MAKLSKKRKAILEAVDRKKEYGIDEAVKLVKDNATCKFDETIDIVMNLGLDPKQSDQQIRGMVPMPNGTGKEVRVAVFARGDKAEAAKAAGAEFVGAEELAEAIEKGESGFDRVVASPDMMAVVGKLGKVLRPRGLMPNPKLGTVTPNVEEAVKKAKAGEVEFRLEKTGIVHAGLAKASFSEAQIEQNLRAFVGAVAKAKPSGAKGVYIQKIGISSSMGAGIKLDIASISEAA